MKLNKIFGFATFILLALTLVNCEEQKNITFDNVNGETMLQFASTSATLAVQPTGVTSAELVVQVTTVSSEDRTVTIDVDATSTAIAAQYTLTPLIIPAGEYIGKATITGNYSALPVVGRVQAIFNITAISGNSNATFQNSKFTANLERFCPLVMSNFYGTFSQQSGFNGAAPANTIDATITAGPVANTLRISNLHATGRGAVIELDYSNPASPKVKHRSEEFGVVFQVAGLGNTYTEDVLGDVAKNTFNPCTNEIRLFFYRRIAQPDGRYYGGSYEVILIKK